jgi:hypothetical protein
MLRITLKTIALTVIAAVSIAACSDESASTTATSSNKAAAKFAEPNTKSPGKPSAPISIDYEVLGKAIVGLPVSINVRVRGTRDDLGPVSMSFSINDRSALRFQEGQVERLDIMDLREARMEQLAVVPQREGRLYVNVSVVVETAGGSMIKSMAIPIQVGSAPEPTRIDGEIKEGPDGELVQSLPAQEN